MDCQSQEVVTSVGRVHVLNAEGGGRLPPVVMIHGLASAGFHYFSLFRGLRPLVRRIVAPDIPMHGFSDALSLRRGADALPQGVKEALDKVLYEPAVIIGNSLGGYMAIKYALARPSRVRALVLASPAGAPMSDRDQTGVRSALSPKSHDQALQLVDNVFPSITEERTGRRTNPLRHMLAAGMRQRLRMGDVQRILNLISSEHYLRQDELCQLMMPILLMWGRGDRLLPRSQLAFFRAAFPHASIEEPESFGHAPYLEETAPAFLRRVITFLKDLPKGAAGFDRV